MIEDYLSLLEKAESSGDFFAATILRAMVAIPSLLIFNAAVFAFIRRKGGPEDEA